MVWNCQMFLILRWDSEAASISCVQCFDLSLGYLSTFYHCAQCGAWEASSLIMWCCCFFCFSSLCFFYFFYYFFAELKICHIRHAESPDSHVVYCRLTKGRKVKTVTPGNVNEVPQYHSRNTGRIPKQRVGERKSRAQRRRERQRERNIERERKKRREKDRDSDIPHYQSSSPNPL